MEKTDKFEDLFKTRRRKKKVDVEAQKTDVEETKEVINFDGLTEAQKEEIRAIQQKVEEIAEEMKHIPHYDYVYLRPTEKDKEFGYPLSYDTFLTKSGIEGKARYEESEAHKKAYAEYRKEFQK